MTMATRPARSPLKPMVASGAQWAGQGVTLATGAVRLAERRGPWIFFGGIVWRPIRRPSAGDPLPIR